MKSQTFGELLKQLRQDLNYSLKFVGETIEYDPKLLQQIEQNERKAPEAIVKKLSKIYSITFQSLHTKYLSENIYYQVRHSEYADEVLNIVKRRIKKEQKGTQAQKSKEKILESIKAYFADKPVEKAYNFGSFARDTPVSMDSDLDILVVFKKPHKITLFDLIQMKEELSNKTGRAIDLVEEGQELKSIRKSIQKEKLLIYAC